MRFFTQDLVDSLQTSLFDEKTFYQTFIQDLLGCEDEVIIESPYITSDRVKILLPIFARLLEKKVRIYVITRDPREHEHFLAVQSEREIQKFEVMGIQTLLCTGNHHRKLAILDRKVLWEGSLNILSQTKSREIMRRLQGSNCAQEMFDFLKLGKFI